jgi:hypothetical protein
MVRAVGSRRLAVEQNADAEGLLVEPEAILRNEPIYRIGEPEVRLAHGVMRPSLPRDARKNEAKCCVGRYDFERRGGHSQKPFFDA